MAANHSRPILVAHSYYMGYDPKQTEKMRPYAPLATLIVAALLRERGHDVRFFDAMLAPGVEAFQTRLADVQPAAVVLVEDNFNFLTKMCTLRMRDAALQMIRAAGEAGARVLVNGADASDHADLYIAAGADAVILGEPEMALLDIVAVWERNRDAPLDDVPGLIVGNGQRASLHRTAARSHLEHLDALPFPAWDLVDVERYRRAWTGAHGRLSWNMVTSRGCPYRCNWCAKPLFGTRYAQRSPPNVAEELSQLRHEVSPDHVWFADDIFGLTPQWIERFAREVAARDAQTPFTMQSRVNLMKPRVVEALAQAGAEEVWLGVESGSQRILDAMDKGTTIEQVRAGTRNLRTQGIRPCWFIQLGYVGEDWDDIVLTRDLIRNERPDDVGVSVSYPLPGTEFYERVRRQLDGKTNWEDTDELAMLFRGTYATEFYRRIRDLLHEEVRGGAERDATSGTIDMAWEALARDEERYRSAIGAVSRP